jgi:pimeloyl-ACP methyl ester carboxylesterase
MTAHVRPTAVLIRRPTVVQEGQSGRFVLSAETESAGWARALSARAARVLWDGLTTNLFGGAGEKFIHAAQTALFQPEADPEVTDWVRVSRDPSGLLVIRGLSTVAADRQNWIARLTEQDGQQLWRVLEELLFAEGRGRVRPRPDGRAALAGEPADGRAAAPPGTGPLRHSVRVADGVQIACEDHAGGEPALLFVHGAFADRSIWRYQAGAFARQHRCVLLDMRGHGVSDRPDGGYQAEGWADDLEQVCAALDLRAPVVIAHSMGASAAMVLAATTRRARGLVLIEPAVITDDREAELFARFSLGPEGTPVFAERFRGRVGELIGEGLPAQLADPLRRTMLATPAYVAAALDEALFTFATGPVASRLRIPALVLLAVHRSEDAHFYRRYLRSADVRVMADDTHFPMLATPGRTNAAISEFIQSLG